MNAGIPRSAKVAPTKLPLAPVFLLLASALVPGCSGVSVEEQAVLTTQPGAALVRLAPLDGCCSLVIASPTRGTLDVYDPRAIEIGSFLSGREGATDMAVGNVGGRPVVFVVGGASEITMLTNDLVEEQHLRHPNRIYQTDATVHAIAVGDLDRDGMDELVVARGDGVKMVDDLEVALFADPEHVPDIDRPDLPQGLRASAVTVAELNGDDAPEILALAADDARVRIWDGPGFERENGTPVEDHTIGAAGRALISTRCAGGDAVFALLDDGSVTGIDFDGATSSLPIAPGADRLVAADDGFLVLYDDGSATVHDGCGGGGDVVPLDFDDAADVHMTRRLLDGRRVAIVREDGQTVELHQIDAGY